MSVMLLNVSGEPELEMTTADFARFVAGKLSTGAPSVARPTPGLAVRFSAQVTSVDTGNRATLDDGSGPVPVVALGGPIVAMIAAFRDRDDVAGDAYLTPNGDGWQVTVSRATATGALEPRRTHTEAIEWVDTACAFPGYAPPGIVGNGRVRVTVLSRSHVVMTEPEEEVRVERLVRGRGKGDGLDASEFWVEVADQVDAARLMAEAALRLYARRARLAANHERTIDARELGGHFGVTHFER